MAKVVKLPQRSSGQGSPRDPLNVNQRLYNQISIMLTELEQPGVAQMLTLRERIAAVIAIGRIQVMFVGLRKEPGGDERSGIAVRKYSGAFKNDPRGRKKVAGRPEPEPEPDAPDDWFERAGIADDDDGDDTD